MGMKVDKWQPELEHGKDTCTGLWYFVLNPDNHEIYVLCPDCKVAYMATVEYIRAANRENYASGLAHQLANEGAFFLNGSQRINKKKRF